MSDYIGNVSVPAYMNSVGEVEIDVDEAEGLDDVGFLGLGKKDRVARLQRKISRIQARGGEIEDAQPADLYQAAAASGAVQENQYFGLGSTTITAGSTAGVLAATVQRNLWGKSLVLDSDSPADISITAITIAGLPFNIGSSGAPMSMFTATSVRFGISFGRRLAMVGQSLQVNATNLDAASGHNLQGGVIADEMNPYMMGQWMERLLLQAAVAGSNGVF